MIQYIIALLGIWMLLLVIQVLVHYIMITVNKVKPVYAWWNLIRGLASFLHCLCFDPQDLVRDYSPVLLFHLTSHFIFHAPALNELRNKSIWYLGNDSGWIDELLNKLNITVYKVIYFIAVVGFALSVLWIFNTYQPVKIF
jgi:hypothetical protein